jgi:hypothetical protein
MGLSQSDALGEESARPGWWLDDRHGALIPLNDHLGPPFDLFQDGRNVADGLGLTEMNYFALHPFIVLPPDPVQQPR